MERVIDISSLLNVSESSSLSLNVRTRRSAINLSIFDPYVEKGLIKKQTSPYQRLVLFDYTEKCQYERAWDEVTLNARGTVYEISTGNVVAKAFGKFFNWGELPETKQNELIHELHFEVNEKLDGSMILLYYYDNEWRTNTRGSFTSDQAVKAKELLSKYNTESLDPELTYILEVIYPENRIVVDYGNDEKLVLLAIYDRNGTEFSIDRDDHNFPKAKIFRFEDIQSVIDHTKTLPYNEEGYVVRVSRNGFRVKFKGDEYVKMHRIVTGTSPLTLWESMTNGKVSKELLISIPEEFRDTYESMSKELEKKYKMVKDEVEDSFKNILVICGTDRKEIGLFLAKNDILYSKMIFPRLLEKYDKLDQMIMREIRPTGNVL